MLFLGWLLVFGSIFAFIQAFAVGGWNGFFVNLLVAILFGVPGFLLLTKPMAGAEVLTMVMALAFIALGVFEIIAPLAAHLAGAGWWVLDGAVTLLLGVLVLAQWPLSGLWAIGLYTGITLLVHGFSWIMFALGLHRM
jgi:uncharacterized membrane protein HdeD (DUF308 family)